MCVPKLGQLLVYPGCREAQRIAYLLLTAASDVIHAQNSAHLAVLERVDKLFCLLYYYSSLSMESLAPFFFALFLLADLNILKHHASDYPVAFELCYHCFCT